MCKSFLTNSTENESDYYKLPMIIDYDTYQLHFLTMPFLNIERIITGCYCCYSVVRLDGSTPTKYGLRLNMDEKYKGLKRHLGELCDIPATQLLLAEVFGALIKVCTLEADV